MAQRFTYDVAPQRVYWETTNACDLACRHCRAEASPERDKRELSTLEGMNLLTQLTNFGRPLPHVVLTGGDPLKRSDLFDFIRYARDLGFGVSVAPSATPLLTDEAIAAIKDSGVDAISLSVDGSTAQRHDDIRGIPGTFERTLRAAKKAREVGLPFQVNTLICAETDDDLEAIHAQVVAMGAARWSLFFLVNVGRGDVLSPVSVERAEEILHWVAAMPRGRGQMVVTTTEAPQLRRVVAETQRAQGQAAPEPPANGSAHPHAQQHTAGIRDGNGILFISNTGEICPSGFLELSCGNVRTDDLVSVYREAPLFKNLRDPASFGGRCGRCEYKFACGGSRARAWSASQDPCAEDPLCPHEPAQRASMPAVASATSAT